MRDRIESSDARVFVKGYKDLLSPEDEAQLFQEWWDSNPEAFQAFLDIDDDDKTQTKRFVGGNDDLYLKRIIEEFSPVIRRSIRELSGYKMEEDELLSEGLISLAEAARRFSPEHNTRFATYAKLWVKGMMQSYIMKNYFLVNICTSHNKKRLFYSMRKLIAIRLKDHGSFKLSHEDATELAEDHDLTVKEVHELYELMHRSPDSLDQSVKQDEESDTSLGELLSGSDAETEETVMRISTVSFHRKIINDAMDAVLDDREKIIFEAQRLTDNVRTLDELGDELNVSKERVRQLRVKAEKKVRAEIFRRVEEDGIDPSDMFAD